MLSDATSKACPLAAAYEQLRNGVLDGAGAGSHFGLVVLLREGVAAWLEGAPIRPATNTPASAK